MRLHHTWLFALVLIMIIVATQFSEVYALWRRLWLGIIADGLFLLAIVIRQLAFNIVARRRGIQFYGVTLFVFGGIPNITKISTSPTLELLLGLAGLFSGLIVVVIFYIIYLTLVITNSVLGAPLMQWITFITLMLVFFDFIPGFPLDGGRIFRAVLWRATDDYYRATLIASWVGWGVGLLFVIGGIAVMVITRHWFTGLVLAFVGWVLGLAAGQSRRQASLHEALHHIMVGSVMSKESALIPPELTLRQLLQDYILATGQRHFVVVDGAKVQGVVTVQDLKSVPRRRWRSKHVREVMTPAGRLKTALPNQSAADLLDQMNGLRIGVVPVLEGDAVVGVVFRDSLNRLGKTRSELRI